MCCVVSTALTHFIPSLSSFAPMNEVWFEWVGEFPEQKGVRACVEAAMARPKLLVEIKVIAAVP